VACLHVAGDREYKAGHVKGMIKGCYILVKEWWQDCVFTSKPGDRGLVENAEMLVLALREA